MDSDKAQLKVEIDPALHRATKVLAAAEGISMTELVSSLIVERLQSTTPTATDPLRP